MQEKLNINQWAEEDRPREKFMQLGPEALTKAELLAILIGSGSTKESAVDLMKRILNDCENNLNTLGKKSVKDLTQYNGMGPAKAISVLAACELGKRRQHDDVKERKQLNSSTDLDVEQAWVILLNQNYKLIKAEQLSSGGISETAVDVRQAMKMAVLNNATVMALAHNHPSNNTTPSKQDDALTQRFKKACDIMRIHFLDHVIVTDGNYYSYFENGRL